MDGRVWAAVAVVAAATLGGAAFAGAFHSARRAALRLGATALLAVVVLDLAPDVVHDVSRAGSAQALVATACLAAFAAAAAGAHWMCLCNTHPGTATAAAIALHRALEGAALALVGSAGVIAALVVHAAGEGFALRTYGAHRGGRIWPLLALACVSPAWGAVALHNFGLPGNLAPIFTALVAGALVAGAIALLRAVPRYVGNADERADSDSSVQSNDATAGGRIGSSAHTILPGRIS